MLRSVSLQLKILNSKHYNKFPCYGLAEASLYLAGTGVALSLGSLQKLI